MSAPPPEPRPSLLPLFIGFALAGATVLILGFWAARRPAPAPDPVITLLTPSADTVIEGSLEIRFRTSGPLALQPTGWGMGPYHVHALVGATELMPGAADIRPQPEPNEYTWALPPIKTAVPLQLVWSRANHSRMTAGASAIRHVTFP